MTHLKSFQIDSFRNDNLCVIPNSWTVPQTSFVLIYRFKKLCSLQLRSIERKLNDNKIRKIRSMLYHNESNVSLKDFDRTLLTPVGEIVIPAADVVVLSGLKLHQHTNVRSRSVVQLVLHLCFGLNRLPAAYGAFHALIVACAGKADGDVFTSEFRSADRIALPVDFGVLEHVGVLEGKRVIVVSVLDFDDVATVGSPSPFSSISSLAISTRILIVMCVGPSPLRVNQLSSLYLQVSRVKIVLYRRICLHDVPAFSTHIQVVNGPRFKSCGSCLEHE